MAIELTQRRIRVAVVLATLTGTSFFVAQGSTQLVASSLLDMPPSESTPSRAAPVPVDPNAHRASREALGRAILERNIFDSQSGAITWDAPPPPAPEVVPGEEGAEGAEVPAEGDPNTPCEGQIRLVAAFVREGHPESSLVTIAAANVVHVFAQGTHVEDREVMEIHRHRVILKQANGQLCTLSMFAEEATVRPVVVAQAPVIAVEPPAAGGDPELDNNISQISETSYAVNRTLVDRLLNNQAELMRTARVIPHEVDGRVVGVKIYGIRRSSVLGRLGIQNGDMLRSINGYDLTEPDSVLEAYTRLRSADHLSLNIDRRGSTVAMDYQIR